MAVWTFQAFFPGSFPSKVLDSVDLFTAWCQRHGMPAHITNHHVKDPDQVLQSWIVTVDVDTPKEALSLASTFILNEIPNVFRLQVTWGKNRATFDRRPS